MYIKNNLFLLYIFIFIINVLKIYCFEQYIDFGMIKKDSPPRFLKEGILFTLPSNIGKYVFLRSNIDNWEKDRIYQKSMFNVYYYFLPYSEIKNNKILYKINIDGFWSNDINNPNFIEDSYGDIISVLDIDNYYKYFQETPIIEETKNKVKNVTFYYYNPEAKEVNLVCSTYNWSIFSYPMKKNSNGFWEIILPFSRGDYYYYFLVDWKKKVDYQNPKKIYNKQYGELSHFIVQ